MTKITIISSGILAATLAAVAQGPAVITPGQTNQVHQTAAAPATSGSQRPATTSPTSRGSSTNQASSAGTSTNASKASGSGTGTPTSSHQITIIRGSDASTSDGMSSGGLVLPSDTSGIDQVKSTRGTSNDWRSDSQKPHVIPPQPPPIDP